jgi:hypothetical protein
MRTHRAPGASARALALVGLLGLSAAACAAAPAPLPTEAAPGATSPGATSPAASAAPSSAVQTPPAGTRSLPGTFGVELEPGTYSSRPPFAIPFTFEVSEPGWVAGHLTDEFVDLQRFEGEPGTGLPIRIVGFARPTLVRGPTGDVPAPALTPREAVDMLARREELDASNAGEIEIAGRSGATIDLHSDVVNNPVFGGDHGVFGLGPDLDLRLVLVPHLESLLALVVLAPPGDLDPAWAEARPILESVELPTGP